MPVVRPVARPAPLDSPAASLGPGPSTLRRAAGWALAGGIGAAALLAAGCRSAEEYRRRADEEVYALLAERRAQFVEDPDAFTIDPDRTRLGQLTVAWAAAEQAEPGAALPPLSLAQCLELAAATDSDVQERKERLYREALDLIAQRYLFGLRTTGDVSGRVDGQSDEAQTADIDGGFGFSQLLDSGALVFANIGVSLFRGLLSSDDWDPVGNLGLSITQPLLAGFGRQVVLEPLTQAERNVLYEVRSYERFRRTFAFDLADDYFRILQSYDALANARANFESLSRLRLRNEALGQAGRLSEIQVDQARQDEFRARTNLIDEQQNLESLLDDFKDLLGLPIDYPLALDPIELEKVVAAGVAELDVDQDLAIDLALELRHDYRTAVERIDDSRRRLALAADDLRARLDLNTGLSLASEPGQPLDYDVENLSWFVELDLDLPLDRLLERNVYRAAAIDLQAAERAASDLAVTITVALRDSLRALESRRQAYDIQVQSVQLAERRVESTSLNFEAGRAETRDLLEAQDALLEARNSLTRALVDYHLATLAFYRDLELLWIDEQGLRPDPSAASRLQLSTALPSSAAMPQDNSPLPQAP
jgi:outer membrane protein TolC